MKLVFFLILLAISNVFASTHVNVSFTQQHSRTGSKLSDSQNSQDQLKPSASYEQFNNDEQNVRFARIKIENTTSNSDKAVSDAKTIHDSVADYRSERVQNEARSGYFGSQSQNQQRSFYNSNHGAHQSHGQFRNVSPLDKQNMEFERYIQNYHSGPTVETVYESAKPEMQHTLSTTSVHEGPRVERVEKFERLVTLPAKADSVQPLSDAIKPIVNHQPVATSNTALVTLSSSSSESSLSPSIPSGTVSPTGDNNFKVNINSNPQSVGKNDIDFDLSYNKPNYNDPSFKYNEGHSDAHFYNQFPPSAGESQNGYGNYYGNVYSRQQVTDGYHPVEQRPVVTKTIQIAQPAIKAKKYEVRHPAIQKEFYDIEERVVIKPAGTVVVELERPSAKILKEETTLPLGHPHPAVAAAYMPNRNNPTFSSTIYSNAGSSSFNHPNNQYIPQQPYNSKHSSDHHSTVGSSATALPPYDQSSKDVNVGPNQNQPYSGQNHFSTAASADAPKPQNREIIVVTGGHGNQRQMSDDQFTYSRDETDKAPSRPVYSHRSSFAYEENSHTNGQTNLSPQKPSFQANLNSRDGYAFDTEYIHNSANTNLRKENKPARLQEESARVTEQNKHQPQPIIKHEHKIVLSPSQHNIYLSRNEEVPRKQFIEESAQVREIKPYLTNHRGPVMVYASTKSAPEVKYVQRSEYKPQARVSAQVVQYHNSQQTIQPANSRKQRVQYSAPYAQMRYHSEGEQSKHQQRENEPQLHNDVTNQQKSEKLIVENNSPIDTKKSSIENTMERQTPQAHIEIKIPTRSSHDANKSIVVSSAIRPMIMDNDRDQTHNSKLEISVTNKGEPKQQETSRHELDASEGRDIENNSDNIKYSNSEQLSDLKTNPNCDQSPEKANYEVSPEYKDYGQRKFMRIVEESSTASTSNTNDAKSAEPAAVHHHNTDVSVKSTSDNVSPPGSRVIAAAPAPKEVTPSESFHKRRIVVNHPFQTVREVVEHEPYTNYHEVQVNEPASPSLYHSANYFQSHGTLRQSENRHYYH